MRKPKLSININKKHIIIACLTLILGISVYVNYAITNNAKLKPTDVLTGMEINEVYGNITYTNGETYSEYSSDDYFAQARLDKVTSRDEAVETLKMILGGGDITEEEIATYTESALTLSALIESESNIENLIKASGYQDCIVYLDGENASIVVKSDGLTSSEVASIKEILLSQVSVLSENIRIFEIK